MLSEHDLYDVLSTLDCGTGETAGDVDRYWRHYTLSEGTYTAEELLRGAEELGLAEELTAEEAEELARYLGVGVILSISGDGWRAVSPFATEEKLRGAWAEILEDLDTRDAEARAEEAEREIRADVDHDLPERWTISHVGYAGCSAPARVFETREEAEEELARIVADLEADGFEVYGLPLTGDDSLARMEAIGPEDQVMVSDREGTYTLRWNGAEREAEVERRLERWEGMQ